MLDYACRVKLSGKNVGGPPKALSQIFVLLLLESQDFFPVQGATTLPHLSTRTTAYLLDVLPRTQATQRRMDDARRWIGGQRVRARLPATLCVLGLR